MADTTPTIYHYEHETGVYVGSGLARAAAGEPGVFSNPAFSTFKQPLGAGEGQVDVFDLAADAWTLVDVPAPEEPKVVAAPPAPGPTFEERLKALQGNVQLMLDLRAQSMGYDDIRAAVTYADEDADPVFQAEGLALRAWRSLVWRACYTVLAAVTSGERAEPTWVELLAELPEFVGVPPVVVPEVVDVPMSSDAPEVAE